MIICCISDTHGLHDLVSIPECDLLIHAGDVCSRGTFNEFLRFLEWFSVQPSKHKVFIAGNHDWCLQLRPDSCREALKDFPNVNYLQDSGVEIEGVKIYGSPWQPEFCSWAFNLPRNGDDIEARWKAIPNDTQILVTHGPPYGVGDVVPDTLEHVGDDLLGRRVREIKPDYHIFGHTHNSYGRSKNKGVCSINAAICTEAYAPTNQPIIIEL